MLKEKNNDWYKNIWSLDIKNQSWVEDTENQVEFIIKTLELTGRERILDLACGFGRHSLSFAKKGYSVVGVDITKEYIYDAKNTAQKEKLIIYVLETLMNKFDNIIDNIIRFGKLSNKIHSLIIIGSHARKNHQADESSDLDLILIVDKPDDFFLSDDWIKTIGEVCVSFSEEFIGEGKTRRILFDGALDVDFIFIPLKSIGKIFSDNIVISILRRGWKILYDETKIEQFLPKISSVAQSNIFLTETEFQNIVNDFWYHSVWTMKKIIRGEIWTAKNCLDNYMKSKILSFIEIYMHTIKGLDYNTWYSGRFIEEWADEWIIDRLKHCFAYYNEEDIKRALKFSMDLFRELSVHIARRLYYNYPKKADDYVSDWIMVHLN